MRPTDTGREAQLHTLEGFAGAMVLLLAVSYAFNAFVLTAATDVNPGAASNERLADDLLALSNDSEPMVKELVLHWNASGSSPGFVNSSEGSYYYDGEPPDSDYNSYGAAVEKVLSDRGLSYNMEMSYNKEGGDDIGSMTVVYNGEPGLSAVSSSRTVVLEDSDNVTSAGGEVSLSEVSESDSLTYPVPKQAKATYNRVRVTITVW